MASILFVSKPIAPPWNDSGKNLVRDVARGLSRHRATLMVRPGDRPEVGNAISRTVYGRASGGFAPALVDQARVFAELVVSREHDLWHFFFAPNPRSCLAGRTARRIRGVRAVHTISSAPRDPSAIAPLLFADVNIVLSRHTEARMLAAGVLPERMVRIPPAIVPLDPPGDSARETLRRELDLPLDAPIVVYPGDLEFGEGGPLMLQAQRKLSQRGVLLVMACRVKTPRAREVEAELRERARSWGLVESIRWVGETARIHDLLRAADVVALPSADLYAKMDYPLVLLEAMSLARPVLVAQGGAAEELCEGDAARACVPSAEALTDELERLLNDASLRAQMGERAAARVRSQYGHEAMARAYEELYDQLLA